MKAIQYMKAAGSFCSSLFSRPEKTAGQSGLGLPLLAGWDQAPEDMWMQSAKKSRHLGGVPRYALYCFSGSHSGEVFFITQQSTFLGLGAESGIVLTSNDTRDSSAFKIELQPHPRVVAEHGYKFLLNGRQTSEAEIYDYDEVELLGNRFLVMDLLNDELKGTA